MIIRSLHLEHYRCFKNLDIEFDEQLTVLVGINGSGKTALLDALSAFLIKAGTIDALYQFGIEIPVNSVSIGSNYKDLIYNIGIQNKDCIYNKPLILPFIVQKNTNGSMAHLIYNIDNEFHEIIKMCRPLCVSYMTGRLIRDDDMKLKNNIETDSPNKAYKNNFNRSIDYASSLEWFNNSDADEARAMRDDEKKEQLPELKAVRDALSKALLGKFERPRMMGNPPELVIYEKDTGKPFKVSQLSDGYRSMLALVMDLSRRMAQVHDENNDRINPILHTPAIVLIDEIELHLHPSWQQTVITTLIDIFPNTQFIVTTHSPQVLTTIQPRHIRILSDGKVYPVNEQTEGAESSRLMKHIFNVDQRPQNIEIVKTLRDYSDLVLNEKYDTEEAILLRKRLDEHFGKDDLELMDLDLHIENSKWEQGL